MVKCPGCGTDVAIDAAMCYACGEELGNPFNLDDAQRALFDKANREMDGDNWEGAIGYYLELVRLRPDVGHFFSCIGMAYAFQDKSAEAWDYYSKAIAAEPGNDDHWQTRLEFALEAGPERLEEHMDGYLRHFSQSTDAKLRLAESILLVSSKHNEVALKLCRQVLDMEPENKQALKLRKRLEKGPGLFSRMFGRG